MSKSKAEIKEMAERLVDVVRRGQKAKIVLDGEVLYTLSAPSSEIRSLDDFMKRMDESRNKQRSES